VLRKIQREPFTEEIRPSVLQNLFYNERTLSTVKPWLEKLRRKVQRFSKLKLKKNETLSTKLLFTTAWPCSASSGQRNFQYFYALVEILAARLSFFILSDHSRAKF